MENFRSSHSQMFSQKVFLKQVWRPETLLKWDSNTGIFLWNLKSSFFLQNTSSGCFWNFWSHLLKKSLMENCIFCAVHILIIELLKEIKENARCGIINLFFRESFYLWMVFFYLWKLNFCTLFFTAKYWIFLFIFWITNCNIWIWKSIKICFAIW